MKALINSNELTELTKLYKKFNGDKERDGYLILDFFKNNGLLTGDKIENNPHSMLYLYLCSLVECILDNSSPESEFLNDEESEFIDKIEEFIDYLE